MSISIIYLSPHTKLSGFHLVVQYITAATNQNQPIPTLDYHIRNTVTPHGMPWQAALVDNPKQEDCLGKLCKATVEFHHLVQTMSLAPPTAECSYI